MSESGDPTFVDTQTLFVSMRRDIGEAAKRLREADGFLREAMATAFELERRQKNPPQK